MGRSTHCGPAATASSVFSGVARVSNLRPEGLPARAGLSSNETEPPGACGGGPPQSDGGTGGSVPR